MRLDNIKDYWRKSIQPYLLTIQSHHPKPNIHMPVIKIAFITNGNKNRDVYDFMLYFI